MIKTFCVAHRAVEFDLPEDATVVWLGNDTPQTRNANRVLIVSEYAPDMHALHAYLGGSAGSFIIERYLRENPDQWNDSDLVSVIQYRKFISPIPVGRPSRNYHGMYVFNSTEANLIDLAEIQGHVAGDYLVSTPSGLSGGVLAQYNEVHHVVDFLRYMAFAVELNVISKDELMGFFSSTFFVPGGIEFGIFPIPVFLECVGQLRRICLEFLRSHRPVSTDDYQRRALSFCNERVGSYLLLKHMNQLIVAGDFDRHQGIMHCLSVDDVYR
jgi:hypothetical protein